MSARQGLPAKGSQPEVREAVRRLHLATLVVPLLSSLTAFLIPAFFAGLWMGFTSIQFVGFWFVLAPMAAFHAIRYVSFDYQLRDSELILRSGLLWRHERRIPLSRIQDTKIHQGIFHRLFGVVKFEITTAASEQREARLNVISREQSALLREAVLRFQEGDSGDRIEREPTISDSSDTLLQLRPGDLLLGGLTSKLVGTLGALLGAVLYFGLFLTVAGSHLGDWDFNFFPWEQFLLRGNEDWVNLIDRFLSWDDTLVGSVVIVLGWLVIGLARFVIQYYNFRLTQLGNVLSKRYGLFTLRTNSLAKNRVQALKVEETLLNRLFGLASVWADSGGDRGQTEEDPQKKRDPLVPIASRREVNSLVESVLPHLPSAEPVWKKVSPKAIWRGTRLGWALLLLAIVLPTASVSSWFALAWLPAFPLIYVLSLKWYHSRGYWVDNDYLISRKGWFDREILYLPVRNLQSVILRRTYFDRRLGLATLVLDTAGQSNTGGGTAIRNLPLDEARQLQNVLAHRVSHLVWPSPVAA